MQLSLFKGGVHPQERKSTSGAPVEQIALPERLYVPLQQHIGAPAEALVKTGDKVLKGQLIGKPGGYVSAPVHAPTSGSVVAIDDTTAPHPSGLSVTSVIIEPDGEEQWVDDNLITLDPFALPPQEVAARVAAAGIVGMGGAAFPAAVKLALSQKNPIHTLIINGGECEPYLTCDDRLMQEHPGQVIDGVLIMLHALGAKRALIGIENNKPMAVSQLTAAAASFPEIEVVPVPTLYPMGSEKQMLQTLTGKEVPAGQLSASIGILVHNVATAYAVHEALRHNRPLVSRVVTVSGGAIKRAANLEVPIGTLAEALVERCGGFNSEPARLLMGGPMMGMALPHLKVPLVKGSNGLLALTADEIPHAVEYPCIRCASCVRACPLGLMPLEMASRARNGDLEGALDFGLRDCISCGTCAYVCPSAIPLTQYFNFAKGELVRRDRDKRKGELTKQLAQERRDRIARAEAEKKAKAAARKAAKEKKKAAEAAAAAAAEE